MITHQDRQDAQLLCSKFATNSLKTLLTYEKKINNSHCLRHVRLRMVSILRGGRTNERRQKRIPALDNPTSQV